MADAGETHSIRLPRGLAAEIRAATGTPLSTLVRTFLLAYRERLRQERRAQSSQLQEDVQTVVDGMREQA